MRRLIIIILTFFLLSTYCLTEGIAKNNFLTDRDKEYLINLARQTLYEYLKDKTVPKPDEKDINNRLKKKCGCFVTLYKRNFGLRGCLGIFDRGNMLYVNIIDRTIAAATLDTRFPVVKYEELKDIKIEISVLTEPIELKFNTPEDLLAKLRPLEDGVVLMTPYGGSTFLPQVWKELPDKEKFMDSLCEKQYAPRDTWEKKYKDIKVFTYQAIIFGEEIYGRRVVGKNGAMVGSKGAYVLGVAKPIPEGLSSGGYKVNKGTKLAPGTIVSSDSDIIEH